MSRNSTRHVCADRLGVTILLCASAICCSAAQDRLYLLVAVRDYAGVPPETLHLAEAQASLIYEKVGLTVEWWELPVSAQGKALTSPDRRAVPPVAYVQLYSDPMAASLRQSPDVFGCALGNSVYVFPDRIRRAAEEAVSSYAKVLGSIMAHEIGHVLLGDKSHTPATIMSPKLGAREFRQMEQGALLFIPALANRLREKAVVQQIAPPAVMQAQE